MHTDTGGTQELIKGNGIVVPVEDSGAISKAILNKLRENMGIKSRKIAESMSWKNIAEAYYKLYLRGKV